MINHLMTDYLITLSAADSGYWPFAKYHVSGPGAVAFMDRMVPNRCGVASAEGFES